MSILNVHTTANFFVKVKKLKIKRANTLIMTKSRKKALKEEAEGLSQELDSAIISLAHDRFAIRQDQSLRKLAERRAELDAFIPTLDTGDSVDLTKGISEKISDLVKDKKYGHIDDVYEILKASGANIENPKKKEVEEKEKEKEREKEPEKNILSEVLFSPEISDEQLNENNKKIYEFLIASGNEPAADYVLDLLTRPEITAKDVDGLAANTLELKKLSEINNKILQKLLEIEESMVDEQDTSVDLPKKEERTQAVALGVNKSTPGIEKVEGGFGIGLDDVIAGLMAGGLTKKLAGMFSFGKNNTPDANKRKRPKKISGEIKKPGSTDVKKTSGKNKSGKILRKMTKLAKFVPFVGTVIAGGTAIYNAVEGYNSASDILEKPEKELSEAEKIAAATGFVVQEFTSIPWVSDGIPAKETAETLIDFANDIFPSEETTSETEVSQIIDKKKEIQRQVDAIKPDVIKEKSMIEVEEGYIETVNQTKKYDVNKSLFANNSVSNVSINTITAPETQETINSFELFDK